MPTPHTDAVWHLATEKWAEIRAVSPDLAPAVALQQRLVGLMIDASARLDETAAPQMTPAVLLDKWRRGIPALRGETVAIPPALKDVLPAICTALAESGAGASAIHIRDAITAGELDADSLLAVSLSRNQKAIRTSALHMGFSPDLVWLIGELGSAPLAHRLALAIADQGPWTMGYCPICGSWPALIESHGASRTLRCSFCAFGWSLSAPRCLYCANAGADFMTAAPDVSRPQRRVELCGKCGGYTKVVDVDAPTPFPLLAIDDLATLDLDRGAMERGYTRPDLFDLDAIEPRQGC